MVRARRYRCALWSRRRDYSRFQTCRAVLSRRQSLESIEHRRGRKRANLAHACSFPKPRPGSRRAPDRGGRRNHGAQRPRPRADDRGRRRRGEVLASMARPFGPGPGARRPVSRPVVGQPEHRLARAGRRTRQLVADRLGRSRSSSPPPMTADNACRSSASVDRTESRSGKRSRRRAAPSEGTRRTVTRRRRRSPTAAASTPRSAATACWPSISTERSRGIARSAASPTITAAPGRRPCTRTASSSIRITTAARRVARSSPPSTRRPARSCGGRRATQQSGGAPRS